MIILFGATQQQQDETLIELNILDALTSGPVPVGGLEGWDNTYLQAQTITCAPLRFEDAGDFNSPDDTSFFSSKRRSKGVVSIKFTDAGASAEIIPVFVDASGESVVGNQMSVSATAKTDNLGMYMAPMLNFDLFGAAGFGISVISISAGSINVKIATV